MNPLPVFVLARSAREIARGAIDEHLMYPSLIGPVNFIDELMQLKSELNQSLILKSAAALAARSVPFGQIIKARYIGFPVRSACIALAIR